MLFVTKKLGLRRLLIGPIVLLVTAGPTGTTKASESAATTSALAGVHAPDRQPVPLGVLRTPAVGAPAHYFHAQGQSLRGNRPAIGARATITVHQPSLRGDHHSLAELFIGTPNYENGIELGWMVNPRLFGDAKPRVFVISWVHGVGTHCYNGYHCGLIVYRDHRGGIDRHEQPPGTALTVGSSVQFSIEHQGGRWWTAVNGTRMGYFLDSLWNGGFTQPDLLQAFGEVAAVSAMPCARMGTGAFPTASSGALISSVGFLPTTTDPVNLTPFEENSTYYNVFKVSGTSIRYGGPGAYPGTPPAGSSCTTTAGGGGGGPPPSECGRGGMCCERAPGGRCTLCAPANGQCQ